MRYKFSKVFCVLTYMLLRLPKYRRLKLDFLPGAALLLMLATALDSAIAQAGAKTMGPAHGEILFLHYRWHHDTLSLVESQRIPALTKPARGMGADAMEKRGPFQWEVVSDRGAVLSTQELPDPALKSVEYPEPGEKQLRRHEQRMDSADVFVRLVDPGPNAKRIRFYRRHAQKIGSVPENGPMPKASAGAPQSNDRTLIGDFPLEGK